MKPVPREMVINSVPELHILQIFTTDEEANKWIQTESETFGLLTDFRKTEGYWGLKVNRCYDLNEVKAYLESYMDRDFLSNIEKRLASSETE